MNELIEKLRILQNKNSLSLYKREVCRDAADAIERLQAKVPRWIPVTERQPPDSGDVIIYTVSDVVGVGCYLLNRWVQWYSGGGIGVSVTHWMPLPKAPDLT